MIQKSGVFRWLVSMSEYKRDVLGLDRGMPSTWCSSSYSGKRFV